MPPETRPYGWQDARRDTAVEMMAQNVAKQYDSETAAMYRADIEHLDHALIDTIDAFLLPLAQALRLIRDTCPGAASNTAARTLAESGIEDPEDDSGF